MGDELRRDCPHHHYFNDLVVARYPSSRRGVPLGEQARSPLIDLVQVDRKVVADGFSTAFHHERMGRSWGPGQCLGPAT